MYRFDFDKRLAKTFVKDFNIPIYVINEQLFFYQVETYGYMHLWNFFVSTLNKFPGTNESQKEAFLNERSRLEDEMVNEIQMRDAYQRFNTCDLNCYGGVNIPVEKKDENIVCGYVSIDLRSANIQALNWHDPEILNGCRTWNEVVYGLNGHNAMSDYFIASKRLRQVVLGKLNPKRAITIEKYIMSRIHKYIDEELDYGWKVVSFNNDEIVYQLDLSDMMTISPETLKDIIFDKIGVYVKVNAYSERKFRLYNMDNGDVTQQFSLRTGIDGKVETKGVPGYLFGIVYKLLRGRTVSSSDKHFVNDNMDCLICDEFVLYDDERKILPINEPLIKDEND